MKNLKSLIISAIAISVISCASESSENNSENEISLNKKVIINTQSLYPDSYSKQIKYYSNNEVVADTTFNIDNQWVSRRVITLSGTTKTFKTYDPAGAVIRHSEEVYDNQNRIISRRTYIPLNLIEVSFVYNNDGTITANATDVSTQITSYIATYLKNSDGLIYKEVRPTIGPNPVTVESTLLFDNLKPTSLINSVSTTTISFDYYSNPMPTDILKPTVALNNEVLLGLSLIKLAEEGNFYYKRNDSSSNGTTTTYLTNFNASDYIDYYKSTYLNTTSNNLLTTEIFYYYNQ
ncbi:MAG: hypothetical protein V4648_09070 [Bacteroidota bacterium]